ncbi:MAG: hypothetical protein ABUL62_24290 [Myxococcales bacterium]
MPSLRCLLLASSVLLLGAHRASADPSLAAHRELRLSWARSATAASCPDAGHVEADVERRLGWSPFVRGTGSAESIEAVVDRDTDVWRAAIELRAADGSSLGSRNVESPANSCASLAAAAGLAIALMIEPLLPPEAQVVPAPAAVTPPATTSKPSSNPNLKKPEGADTDTQDAQNGQDGDSDRSARRRSSSPVGDGSLALGAIGVSGVLPHFALGVSLSGSVRLVDRWFVDASGSFLPQQHVQQGGGEVGFGMTLGALGTCYRVPLATRLSVASCASLLLGSMQVIVNNPQPVAAGSHPWWAASAGLRLGWNPGRFQVAIGVDGIAHFERRSYRLERAETLDSASLFVEPAAALAGSLALGVGF